VAPNQANGFIVSPVSEELTVAKGQSQSFDISVQNPTTVPVIAHAIVNDFEANPNESGVPALILIANTPLPVNSFKSLVSPIADTTLAGGQKKYISVFTACTKLMPCRRLLRRDSFCPYRQHDLG